jgi:hypothetical protein
MRIRCERRCRIELPDGALADRERALLIAMRRLRPSESGAIQARHGEDLSARQSRPSDLDLRRRDPACHRETLAAGIGACNGARQGGDLLRECGIKAGGAAQPVPDRVAGGARLAFGRLRTTAAAAIGPARFTPCCADHAVPQIMQSPKSGPSFMICSNTVISGMQAKKSPFAGRDRAIMPPLTRSKCRKDA